MLAPAGDVYQAGTLSGNPLAVAAGLATLDCSTNPHTCGSRRSPSAWPRACATAAARATRCRSRPCPGLSRSSSPSTRVGLRGRARMRHRGLRSVVPGAALARRLPAAVAVRGVVSVAGPRAPSSSSARSQSQRRRSRPPGRCEQGVSAGARERMWPGPARGVAPRGRGPGRGARRGPRRLRAVRSPAVVGGERARGRGAGATSTNCSSRRSTRATCSTTAQPRVVRCEDADLGAARGGQAVCPGSRAARRDRRHVRRRRARRHDLPERARAGRRRPRAGAGGLGGRGESGRMGPSPGHDHAKSLVLTGSQDAIEAMRTSARACEYAR